MTLLRGKEYMACHTGYLAHASMQALARYLDDYIRFSKRHDDLYIRFMASATEAPKTTRSSAYRRCVSTTDEAVSH